MSFKAILSTVFVALAATGAVQALAVNSAQTYYGDATYYYPNGGLGACGAPNQNTDLVVALSADQYAGGANCYRHIGIHYNGQFVDATVVDLCPGCASGSIDLSPSAFQQLASLDAGRIQVSWDYE